MRIQNRYEELYDNLDDIEASRVILTDDIATNSELRTKFHNAVVNDGIISTLTNGFY